MKKKVVVLVSGGMDSVTALYEAHGTHQVIAALSFHYGSKHNAKEIAFAVSNCATLQIPHRTITLDFVGKLFKSDLLESGGDIPDGHYEHDTMKHTVVPFRNGIMLSIAAGYTESIGAQAVVIAAHAGDHAIYPDCREDFMKSMSDAIRIGTYPGIEILRPFIRMTKADIAEHGTKLGVNFSQTWSCYRGRDLHCGACGTCVERREAFILAKLHDPTAYEQTAPLPAKPALAIK